MKAFLALVRKDLRLYFSNRRALIVTLAAPIAIAAFFGSVMGGARSSTPTKVPVVIVDQDQSAISADVVKSLAADPMLAAEVMPLEGALAEVKKGKRRAAIVLPAGFGDAARRAMFQPGAKPGIAIHYDPSQGMVLAMVKGMLMQHAMKAVSQAAMSGEAMAKSREEVLSSTLPEDVRRDMVAMFESVEKVQKKSTVAATGGPGAGFEPPFTTEAVEVTAGRDKRYNPYAHSFGGMSVQFLMFLGIDIGVGLLLTRRLGLWKRLRAAPVTRGMLLGSTVASTTIISILLMFAIFAAGMAFFNVRIEGSVAGFVGVVIAFSLLTASFGLLLASIGNNPEATRGLAIFATLVLVMLGGAWVPSFIFPEWLQQASLVVPTRWAVDGLAAMTWRGLPFEAALAPMGVMAGFSVVLFGIALWRFRWEE